MAMVYNSPSAQEHNLYAVQGYTEEKVLNMLCDKIEALNAYNGITQDRNRPEMTLLQIVADSNAKKPKIHGAYHTDATGTVNKARGCTVFCWMEKGKTTESQKIANLVYEEVSKVTPMADRGVKSGNHLAEVRDTHATAFLCELDFHDSPDGANFILNNLDRFAEAICIAYCRYFGITFRKPEPPKPQSSGNMYRVQVGAFTVKANAERLMNELKSKGYNAFIKEE